jgi:hypothetical protein
VLGEGSQKMARIARAVSFGRYRYTIHAAQQRIARAIRRNEIESAIMRGEIIEDYPEHRYGPCCLVFGITDNGKALHIVCSLREIVDVITVYEPDPAEWEADLRTRRR